MGSVLRILIRIKYESVKLGEDLTKFTSQPKLRCIIPNFFQFRIMMVKEILCTLLK